jgi:hypothetical protein
VDGKCGLQETSPKFSRAMKKQMKAHDGFMSFLGCVTYGISSEHPIPLLNQGPTTSMAYYRLVEEYLELPTGLKLKHVRQSMDPFRRMDALKYLHFVPIHMKDKVEMNYNNRVDCESRSENYIYYIQI